MKNTFKKIAASIMAVASLAISATGVIASAAEARYGGSGTFYVNGTAVTKYIDGYKTTAAGSTTCNPEYCSSVSVSVTGNYAEGGSKSDYYAATRGTVSVGFGAESGKSFNKISSSHSATIGTTTGSEDMLVYV